MSAPSRGTAGDLSAIDALKRVRAAEIEWEQRLQAAKQEAASELARLRADAEAAVKAAQAAAEADRAERLELARGEADREAARIVADGERAAADAATEQGRRPADRADEIFAAVLAGFQGA